MSENNPPPEALLREVEAIISAEDERLSKKADNSTEDALRRSEQAIHDNEPLEDNCLYDVWVFELEATGDKETLDRFRQERSIQANDVLDCANGDPTACASLRRVYQAVGDKHEYCDVKELLENGKAIMALHKLVPNIVGLLVRTKAFATEKANKADKDSRLDVIVCATILSNRMYFTLRDELNGKMLEGSRFVSVSKYNGSNRTEVERTLKELGESQGRLPALIYGAVYLPMVMKSMDREMYDAFESDIVDIETDDE